MPRMENPREGEFLAEVAPAVVLLFVTDQTIEVDPLYMLMLFGQPQDLEGILTSSPHPRDWIWTEASEAASHWAMLASRETHPQAGESLQ
jgi:hypothetical protein